MITSRKEQSDFFDRMAIAEAHRKNSGCQRMVYGDYFGNTVRCQTCLKDCSYAPVGRPSEEEINSAKCAINRFRGLENQEEGTLHG